MAAITTPLAELKHGFQRVRTASAQASVGQTDWFAVPVWARYMRVTWNLTAVGGTTNVMTPTILSAVGSPSAPIDSPVHHLGGTILTSGFTAAGSAVVSIGPGVSGIANDVALGTTGVTSAFINDVLPSVIGFKTLLDRGDGDETYTYTLDVELRR